MYSARFRKLITLIVTSIVAFVAIHWLMPDVFTNSIQTLEDIQEVIAGEGKEKSYLELGIESMKAGNAEAGWKYLTTAIEQDPDNPELYYKRANAALRLGNLAQVDADIEQTLLLNPDHIPALIWTTSSLCYRKETPSEECFAAVDHILKLDPTNFEAFSVRAKRYRDMEEDDKAIADYTSAIHNMPRDVEPSAAYNIYIGRAGIYFQKNMLKEAIADFNAGLDADPKVGPYALYGAYSAFNKRLSIIDPESENYEPLEKLIARLKH